MSLFRSFALFAAIFGPVLGTSTPVSSQETRPEPRILALVGGTVIASPDAEPLAEAVVIIQDGKIAAVGPEGSVQVPAGAAILTVEGQYLTAGFWNAHVHLNGFAGAAETLSDDTLGRALELGLTRWGFVRVLEPHTSDLENTREIRRRIRDGSVPGPSILTAGAAFDPAGGSHIGLDLPEIDSPPEAHAKVRERIEEGVDAIKLMTGSLSPDSTVPMPVEVARAAVEEAHSAGLPVLAHPSDEAGARSALEAGVDALAHVFATNVSPDWDRTLVDRMVEQGTALIPTLMIFGASSVAEAQLRRFEERGGPVLFGTDLGYHTDPDPSSEYWLMHRAGMSLRQILAALTTAPARFFGLEDEIGRVAPGYAADLVVLDEDPLVDPLALTSVQYALREGRVIFDGGPWDPNAWERLSGRRYVPVERGIPTLPAARWDGGPVELSVREMARYEGVYAWGDEPLRVWVDDGRLRVSPIDVLDRMHLVPLGDHEFVQGLYRESRLAKIYQPAVRVRFVIGEDRAEAVVFTHGDWSSGRLERIE